MNEYDHGSLNDFKVSYLETADELTQKAKEYGDHGDMNAYHIYSLMATRFQQLAEVCSKAYQLASLNGRNLAVEMLTVTSTMQEVENIKQQISDWSDSEERIKGMTLAIDAQLSKELEELTKDMDIQ